MIMEFCNIGVEWYDIPIKCPYSLWLLYGNLYKRSFRAISMGKINGPKITVAIID